MSIAVTKLGPKKIRQNAWERMPSKCHKRQCQKSSNETTHVSTLDHSLIHLIFYATGSVSNFIDVVFARAECKSVSKLSRVETCLTSRDHLRQVDNAREWLDKRSHDNTRATSERGFTSGKTWHNSCCNLSLGAALAKLQGCAKAITWYMVSFSMQLSNVNYAVDKRFIGDQRV